MRHGYTDSSIAWGDDWIDPVIEQIMAAKAAIATMSHPRLSPMEIVEYLAEAGHSDYAKYHMAKPYLGFSKEEIAEFGESVHYLVKFYNNEQYGRYVKA